jgi:hypothetical protein
LEAVSNPKITRSRLFLGGIAVQCAKCGEKLAGSEIMCPGCFCVLKDNIDLQLERLEPMFDAVLHKHHHEAVFDFPGGFCDGEGEDEEP